ncbi:MAG: hypothetical protein A2Z31_07275 [candidate division NC10 bacterium RBG_16_65_8]|nr:MAG: hypothetical protein A2Z31_07275 [candidate division NC10 bacterium RBG_16_65_8]
MTNEGLPEEATPASRWPARAPRSTPELIVELQVRATALTLAAIAVVRHDVTQFVFAIDDDPLRKLNALIAAGGHPIGLVGARIGGGTVEYHSHPFVEYRDNPDAVAYLQTLRVPFLTLLRTHVDRMPDNPRWN